MIIKHKIILFTTFIVGIISQHSYAQLAENALKVAEPNTFGTARLQGIGGAGYALGGDISAAAINPAGLGFFNRSAFVITPTFNAENITANYLDHQNALNGNTFGISNLGIVFNNTKDDLIPSNWRGGSFSITYNRIVRHTFNHTYGPSDNPFSILDEFAGQARGQNPSDLDNYASNDDFQTYADAAYFNYLINPTANNEYVPSIPAETIADQDGTVEETSRLSQWNFAYGGNYKDKLYLGASIGFKSFNYDRSNTFSEYYKYPSDYIVYQGGYFFPVPDGNISIDSVTFNQLNEVQRISSTGINANLGIIYRPVNELTIGLSYQTPTLYSVTEEYQFDLQSNVYGILESDDPNDAFNLEGEDGYVRGRSIVSQYNLTTPSRLGLGLAYFFQKYGFLTADVEYVNYQKNRFNSNEFATSYLNTDVSQIFNSAINYKLGGEFRYDIFRLRLGYAMYQDPTRYQNADQTLNRDRQVLSAGAGISIAKFFADVAVTNTQFDSDYKPYVYASYFPLSETTQRNNITQVSLTLGFNF